MRPVHFAWLLCLSFPAAALAASAPHSKSVPPPKCPASVGFPALDAASKDAAKMSTKIESQAHKGGKITPEYTRTKKGSGKVAPQGCVAGQHADEAPKETVH